MYLALLGFCIQFTTVAQIPISHYSIYFGSTVYQHQPVLTLRKFKQAGQTKYWGVNINTLQTLLLDSTMVKINRSNLSQLNNTYANSPYIKAVNNVKAQPFTLQDAGLTYGQLKEQGITLTIDLCPSHKPLDRKIFSTLIQTYADTGQPVPVAISISGRFLLSHAYDLDWLNTLEKNGKIKITWINHTYSHFYTPKIPLDKNFMLTPGININFEVMALEKALLERNILPSVFFRFPGLVADKPIVQTITNFGLIPVGSNAWLAKGQLAKNNSIVLIHGNGNEPLGVKDFLTLLNTNKKKAPNKQWMMYGLPESIKNRFEK